MRAEVVGAHVRGEKDRAAADAQRLEVLAPGELPLRDRVNLAKAFRVTDAPGVVPEDAVAAEEVRERGGAGEDDREVAHDAAPPRPPQQKEERPEADDGRLDPRRHVAHRPAAELPPEYAAHLEAAHGFDEGAGRRARGADGVLATASPAPRPLRPAPFVISS